MLRRPVVRQFLTFAVIGAAAFVVDAGIITALHAWTSIGLYGGRVISFLCAATFTWLMNRLFTFKEAVRHRAGAQWLHFMAVNLLGGVINFGVYAWLIQAAPLAAKIPALAVAAGSLAGLMFNFSLSKAYVFRAAA